MDQVATGNRVFVSINVSNTFSRISWQISAMICSWWLLGTKACKRIFNINLNSTPVGLVSCRHSVRDATDFNLIALNEVQTHSRGLTYLLQFAFLTFRNFLHNPVSSFGTVVDLFQVDILFHFHSCSLTTQKTFRGFIGYLALVNRKEKRWIATFLEIIIDSIIDFHTQPLDHESVIRGSLTKNKPLTSKCLFIIRV